MIVGYPAEEIVALPPIAIVQRGLAREYRSQKATRPDALEQYLLAAEALLGIGEPVEALAELRAAKTLLVARSPSRRQRWRRLEREALE